MPEAQPPPLVQQIQADILAQTNQYQQGDHARPRGDRGHSRVNPSTLGKQHFKEHHEGRSPLGRSEKYTGISRGYSHKENRTEKQPADTTILYAHADAKRIENQHPLKQDVPLYAALQNLSHISPGHIEDATFVARDAWKVLADGRHTQAIVDELAHLSKGTLIKISQGDAAAMTQIPGMQENHKILLSLAPKGTLKELKNATNDVVASWNASTGQVDQQSLQRLAQAVEDAVRSNPAALSFIGFETLLLGGAAILMKTGRKKEALALLSIFTTTVTACGQAVETATPVSILTPTGVQQSIESVGHSFDLISTYGVQTPVSLTDINCAFGNTPALSIVNFGGSNPLEFAVCTANLKIENLNPVGLFVEVDRAGNNIGRTWVALPQGDETQKWGWLLPISDGKADMTNISERMQYMILKDAQGNTQISIVDASKVVHPLTISANNPSSLNPKNFLVLLGDALWQVSPDHLPSVTATPPPTDTLPATITVAPTETFTSTPELTFGLPAKVEQCISMDTHINADGTIKPDFLAGERAYLTKYLEANNLTVTEFAAKFKGHFSGSIEQGRPYFLVPYLDYEYGGPIAPNAGPGVFVLDCGTKADGSIILSVVAIPSDYPEITDVKDIPILNFQYFFDATQYALSQRHPPAPDLGGGKVGFSSQEFLDMLNNQNNIYSYHFGVAAPYNGIPADDGTVWDKLYASLRLASSGVFPPPYLKDPTKGTDYVNYIAGFGGPTTIAGWDKPLIAKTLNNRVLPLDFISVDTK